MQVRTYVFSLDATETIVYWSFKRLFAVHRIRRSRVRVPVKLPEAVLLIRSLHLTLTVTNYNRLLRLQVLKLEHFSDKEWRLEWSVYL